LQDPPKFTQIWIFGLKTNHLATLHPRAIFKGGLGSRVARFFLGQHTKTGKNIPNNHKIYKKATKVYQMAVKWTK
jgi:hypothetical protein